MHRVCKRPLVCKMNVKNKLTTFFLLPYFLLYKSSLQLILSNYTVSRSCNLQLLLNAKISTFAGNYNCELLLVLCRWVLLSNLNIPNITQFLSRGNTNIKKVQIIPVKLHRP